MADTNPFGDALAALGKTTENLEAAAESLKEMVHGGGAMAEAAARLVKAAEALERPARGGKKGPFDFGDEGGRAARPDGRGAFGRAFDASRPGRTGARYRATAGRAMGGEGASGTGGLSGGAAGMARAAGVVGIIVGAGEALVQMRRQIEQMTTAAIESRRKFAEISGPMAEVFAKREVRDLLRDQKVAERLAPSTSKLAEAESKRKDAMAPIMAKLEELSDKLLTLANDGLAKLINELITEANKIFAMLGWGPDFLKKLNVEPDEFHAFDAMVGPGGVMAMAAAIEADAAAALAAARAAAAARPRPGFGPAAAAGRLP